MKTDHRIALLLFMVVLALYLAAAQGHLNSPDELQAVLQAQSLLERGSFAVDYREELAPWLSRGRGDLYYVKAPVGHSLLLFPWVAAGNFIGQGNEGITLFIASIANTLTGALIAACFYLIARGGGFFSARSSLSAALLLAFATSLWPYSRFSFGETGSGFFLLLGLGLFLQRRNFLSGLCVGLSFLVKYEMLPLFAVFVTAFFFCREGRSLKNWLGGWGIPLLLFLIFNGLRFGSPFETGYTNDFWNPGGIGKGILGILISPGVGALWYDSLLLLALVGGLLLWRQGGERRGLSVILGGLFLVHLIVNASSGYWTGGWAWGDKRMAAVLPVLFLAVPPVLERARKVCWQKGLILLLALWGLAVQIASMAVPFTLHLMWASSDPFYAFWTHPLIAKRSWEATLWQVKFSPLWDRFRLIMSGETLDILTLHTDCRWTSSLAILLLILAVLGLVQINQLLKRIDTARGEE